MAADEPPYLTVGTDVSAKYKGAFCEAKIKKVIRVVKCKVTFKNNLGSFMVTDDLIKGSLRIGADIEAKHPEKNQFCDAVINKLQDYSQYTVVFDDGDETTLRRTSLCLKSGRHFAESPTLDQFPLTHPEHFGTPVIGAGKSKRKRRSTMNSSLDYESSDEDVLPRKLKAIRGKERDPDLGKVVCVDYGDRRKKDNWYPGLIVPHPPQSNVKISKEEHLIRSFKDGKYYQVPKRDTREFIKENTLKIENNALKIAVDKAILYLEKEELPPHWDKALFLGLELPSADEDSNDSDSDSSDDEPSEEKDRFVAQLYKFMDERGTPINKAPTVSNKDLNLYKLFKIMHKLGGYNKVTNKNKWKAVYSKMGLPASNINGPNQIKFAYKRYLQSFEDFYRKLGCTMVSNSRSTRGRHRSDRNFIVTRTRERDTTASPKGRTPKESKEKGFSEKKADEKPKVVDKKEVKSEESSKAEEKSKSPEKKKTDRLRAEEKEKEEKKKREEKPRLVRQQSLNKEKKDSIVKEDEKKESKPEKARTREDARKEKYESPEKKGTRSSAKIELEKKEREEALKEKKDKSPKEKDKKEDKVIKEIKEEKTKEKKEDKIVKDRKVQKEKKVEEKNIREKRESIVREKREERVIKEKRDSSKEPKEDKGIKSKKDDAKSPTEDKPAVKKKLDRVAKEKKEEKVVRSRRDEKSPSSDASKKSSEDIDIKIIKEEKPIKIEQEVKKEDLTPKEKSRPKLRERRDDTPISEDGDKVIDANISDERDGLSQDGFERRGPGARLRGDDSDEPPNKGKRSLKGDDKDDKESLLGLTDSEDEFGNDSEKGFNKDIKHNEIEIGDRVKVKYGRGRMQKVYEAKVLKIEESGEKRFYVHYAGWNMRYDEWVRRSYIVANISSNKQKENASKSPQPSTSMKKIDKSRPPGMLLNTKPVRKNSTSSTNSSISCPRATRSDKKNLQSPFSSGLEPRKRARRKSGPAVGLTDTSQESESDGDPLDFDDDVDADIEDNAPLQNDSCFKEELFSDDEEKEKLEDVKRGDITELEKAISVEENTNDTKVELFPSISKATDSDKVLLLTEGSAVSIDENKLTDEKGNIPGAKVETQPHEEKVKVEVEKCDIDENNLKCSLKKEEKEIMPTSFDVPVVNQKNNYSDLIKPAKIIFPGSTAVSEPKVEKSPLFLPLSVNSLTSANSNMGGSDITSKSNSLISSSSSVTNLPSTTEAAASTVSVTSQTLTSDNKAPILANTVLPSATKLLPSNNTVCMSANKMPPSTNKVLPMPNRATLLSSFRTTSSSAKAMPLVTDSVHSTMKSLPSSTGAFSSTKSMTTTVGTSLSTPKPDPPVASVPSNTNVTSLNKSSLSFAGLHGLIQKSAFEKIITPEKNIPKDSFSKISSSESILQNTAAKINMNFDSHIKPSTNLLKSDRIMPVFGSNSLLSTPQKFESVKKEEVGLSKSTMNLFGSIRQNVIEQNKGNKEEEAHKKSYLTDITEAKITEKPKESLLFSKYTESKATSSLASPFKTSIVSSKFNCRSSSTESKSKDSFDLLVQGGCGFASTEQKHVPEISGNVFSLSFSHPSPKDKFNLEQPYKLEMAHENPCRIKSKPSDTVDLSKTIPSILERLKKDVAGQKITDSPPPQKEELNFDFLRGSQDSTKCLSRSDSSNSLRICEDISDTNDSNTDSKDLIINEKPDIPLTEPALKANDIKIINKDRSSIVNSETSSAKNSPVVSEDNSSSCKLDESKIEKSTSVVTSSLLQTIKPRSNILQENDSSKDLTSDSNAAFSKSDEPEKVLEFPKTEEIKNETPTNQSVYRSEMEKPSNFACSSKTDESKEKGVESLVTKTFDIDEKSQTKVNSNSKTEVKNSLFDDLLKIKCSNLNYTQNSVIMRAPEAAKVSDSSSELEIKMEVDNKMEKDSSSDTQAPTLVKESCTKPKEEILVPSENSMILEKDNLDKLKNPCLDPVVKPEIKLTCDETLNQDDDGTAPLMPKKEGKRKKLSKKLVKKFGSSEDDKDSKIKESKNKSKKRSRVDDEFDKNKDSEKNKTKKLKKNKNKKRFAKHDDQSGEHIRKSESKEDEFHDTPYDKMKRKEKRKNEKKIQKYGLKNDDFLDTKSELTKKKKGKKNRDKMSGEKKDFSEKKTKKKKKFHLEDNQDTDSEKDTMPKMLDKKKKKDRKKFKAKECSSSDDAAEKFFHNQSKNLNALSSGPESLMRQESKSDDPDMSFLLCEEKVPASPVDISNLGDDTSGSSSAEGSRMNNDIDRLPLPNVYPCLDNMDASDSVNKHNIDTSAVLDNTPPTTPSSTESLLSSSPSHERDSFPINYPESTQSGRESCEGDSDIFRVNANRTVMRGSEEYRAAATLAFAVCKTVSERPKEDICHNFPKRTKVEPEDHIPSKRKKKSKRMRRSSESAKSPRHKPSFSRMPKIENCEDSSGASPATSNSPPYGSTSNINYTRCSPHRLSVVDGMSRYNYYVPLYDKDPEKRIAVLQEKMAELRKEYMALRAKVIAIDHKRRKARKKVREAAGASNTNPSVQSEDGQSCS